METKGIIRRLDDLGRIVVPKEYRRMLKIELGDPLEIFTLSNGDIVLRRFDMSAAVKNEGELAAAALENETGRTVLVADKTHFVAGAGKGRSDLIGTKLSPAMIDAMNDFRSINTSAFNDSLGVGLERSGFQYVAFSPITNNSMGYGALAMFADEPIPEEEARLTRLTAQLVAINLQRY